MRSISFLLLSLLIPFSHAFECNYIDHEYACIVLYACIADNGGIRGFVEFDPKTQKLKDDCVAIFALKYLNDSKWRVLVRTNDIERDLAYWIGYPNEDGTSLASGIIFHCNKTASTVFAENFPPLSQVKSSAKLENNFRHCESTIQSQGIDMHSYLKNKRISLAGTQIELTDKFLQNVERGKSCDASLINVLNDTVSEGELIPVETEFIGKGAKIDCMHKRADRLYIKRANDSDFIEVKEVSCPKEVWAVLHTNDSSQNLGSEKFDLKCVRNFCKYCGTISEDQLCKDCVEITYDECMPQCKNNRWVRSNQIIESEIQCLPNKENDETGSWTVKNNGVDVPLLEGSCYAGTFPLPAEQQATTSSSSSFSQRAILLVLLAAFN